MRVLRILLAEDNRGDVLLVRQSLEQHQIEHELNVVNDAQVALEYVWRMGKSNEVPCPDLMLLDLNLPKGDGSMVLAEFRNHPECAETPVIVLTSSESPKDRDEMARMGVSYYFHKPTDYEDYMQLGSIIKEVLQQQAA
jgi:CheY-like chemotaxis protein